ncbi:unnamed protein product [Arabidopsis halleri]
MSDRDKKLLETVTAVTEYLTEMRIYWLLSYTVVNEDLCDGLEEIAAGDSFSRELGSG